MMWHSELSLKASGENSLSEAGEIYRQRSQIARKYRESGKKVIGYPCVFVPLEMLTALDLVPHRTYGDIGVAVSEANKALPSSFCPIMCSCFECALKAGVNVLDGMVVAHSCDPQEKTSRLWESYLHYPYFHFIDVPGTTRPEAMAYFKGQLSDLKRTLQFFTGRELTSGRLKQAIRWHNEQRALVRGLYKMTRLDPPLLSGTEMLIVMKALTCLQVVEGNDLLRRVSDELKRRHNGLEAKPARLLVWSSSVVDIEMMQMLETGANVVIDEGCGGMRPYRSDVEVAGDPLEMLARYYLTAITCPRTFRQAVLGETIKDYSRDIENRFGYLEKLAREWKVDAAVILLPRYCDPFAFEVPSLRDFFTNIGIPSIYIEYDYSRGALAPLRTRVEAFLESIA